MEELVLSEAITRVAEIEATSDQVLDVGDIAAYALNRLVPLYATTEEGAEYQRQRAKKELQGLISQQVGEAIALSINRPSSKGKPIAKSSGEDVLQQVNSLLKNLASDFEKQPNLDKE